MFGVDSDSSAAEVAEVRVFAHGEPDKAVAVAVVAAVVVDCDSVPNGVTSSESVDDDDGVRSTRSMR